MSTEARGLKAIMFTDVVGYSALMADDEARAMSVLARQRVLLPALIASHGGTLHKELGDGTLSTFPSAVDALKCAQALQAVLLPEAFQVRIGVHLGEVIVQEGDVFGDGVNTASRIEALADPRGIVMSADFHRAVRNQSSLTVRSLGKKHLKNIGEPIELYALDSAVPVSLGVGSPSKTRWWAAAGLVAVLALGGVVWRGWTPNQEADDTPSTTVSQLEVKPAVAAAVEKSIAVLPFVNMSPDKDQEYFADGMSEELLNLLAKAPDLKVIARTSSFAFKGKEIPIAEIATQLGVAHVLEGSVRRSGNTVRITAQLIRAADSSHLWSETYDRPLDDIFKLQDEIAGSIAQALQIRLMGGVLSRREGGTSNLDAYQRYLVGLSGLNEGGESSMRAAVQSLEEAIALDPNFALAHAVLADTLGVLALDEARSHESDLERASDLVGRALEIAPNLARGHAVQQFLYTATWKWAESERAGERALALEPNDPYVLQQAAFLARTFGRWKDAELYLHKALAGDPINAWTLFLLGKLYQFEGRYAEAENWFRKLVELEPSFGGGYSFLGAALLMQGRAEEAISEIEREQDAHMRLYSLPAALRSAGREREADKALGELIAQFGEIDCFGIAVQYAFRGENDTAMQWLERAYARKEGSLAEVATEPFLVKLRDDPRYKAFLRKMKLPETPPG